MIYYTQHALSRMSRRNIGKPSVEAVVQCGFVVIDQSKFDRLILGLEGLRVITNTARTHVISAFWNREHRISPQEAA